MMRPDSVNILGKTFAIVYVQDSRDVCPSGYELLWGYIDYLKREIRLYDNGRPEDVFEVLLHEVIHGLGSLLSIQELLGEDDASEKLVNNIALGLADFLVRNDLVDLEYEEISEEDILEEN